MPDRDQDNNNIDPRLFVGSAEKALRILQVFQEHRQPQSLTEITESTGLGRSATQRFIYTLKALGYLRQDKFTKRYTLSPKVLDFGFTYLRNDYLVEKAFPYLLEASKRTDETVNLTELDDKEVIYVSRLPSRHLISVDILLGQRLPVYCTAPGRAILAGIRPDQASDILERSNRQARTKFTITELAEIERKLEEVRHFGYALSNQESFLGDISIAAAIRNHAGDVVAAINIAVPHPRWSIEEAERDLAPVVIETAWAITKALGGRKI
ncbi:IclR family transcriptional regulator [Fodinicurvata sediminis]|uniref:IclR family transcriptional regulator n=1 Tax=Fodinicurvata sediminis TaxID=1121832 RepID=UPI0003B4C120|nr:IclR family transcriptional regulator C-terminal domain-containing protein [Fodinicurvata sediminis]